MNSKKPKLTKDRHNVRIHDERNKQAIRESLTQCGTGRSIICDSQNVIIGGNGVYEEAQKLGIPVRIIESDGTELIAIRRTDLKTDDLKRKALAIADNRCNDLSFFDEKKLAETLKDLPGELTIGFSDKELAEAAGMPVPGEQEPEEKPEVEFSEELLESHNYVVLFFDNDVDWLQAQTLFQLKTVKDTLEFKNSCRMGIGRVINGADAINRLLEGGK